MFRNPRQTKGEQFKRGYFQKSFVMLTRKPYINLFHNIVQIVAPQVDMLLRKVIISRGIVLYLDLLEYDSVT